MSARIALKLPPLELTDLVVPRSGFRWICQDGQFCKAGEIIAFCNIAVLSANDPSKRPHAFLDERYEFQAALVLDVDGRVQQNQDSSQGGFIDRLPRLKYWNADFVLGYLERAQSGTLDRPPLRLMLGAGRRVTEHAEVRSGFLTGWHMRSRAWWADGPGVEGTVLGLGSCEISSILVGDGAPFAEMLRRAPGFAHVVMQPDQILAPCARITLEQMQRTPEQGQAILAAFSEEMRALPMTPTPADWLFGGILLSALIETPLSTENYLLSQGGLQKMLKPNAIFTSLAGESRQLFRHRRLGYALNFHGYRLDEISPVMLAWLRLNFEPLKRDAEDIKSDLSKLNARTRASSPTSIIIMNSLSTDGNEDINSYRPFDLPMGRTVASIHNKELNLMLHELAREDDVSIIDQDAIVAEMGAQHHLPDGAHQSGPLQEALRGELLWALERRAIPGFCKPAQVTSKLTASAVNASPS
jgi:hypothetical protein